MTQHDWTITFTCPDYMEGPVTLHWSSAEFLEATRCNSVSELIEGTQVEGALVAYGEGVQDGVIR